MENILLPTETLEKGIDKTKMKVKATILKVAGVEENPKAFNSDRAGFQVGFNLKTRQDALKVLAVATANDMDCGGLCKENADTWSVFVNIYTTFR